MHEKTYGAVNKGRLTPSQRAWEMVDYPEIPIELDGLDAFDRALIMVHRPDCTIDFTGMDEEEVSYVLHRRPLNKEALMIADALRIIIMGAIIGFIFAYSIG